MNVNCFFDHNFHRLWQRCLKVMTNLDSLSWMEMGLCLGRSQGAPVKSFTSSVLSSQRSMAEVDSLLYVLLGFAWKRGTTTFARWQNWQLSVSSLQIGFDSSFCSSNILSVPAKCHWACACWICRFQEWLGSIWFVWPASHSRCDENCWCCLRRRKWLQSGPFANVSHFHILLLQAVELSGDCLAGVRFIQEKKLINKYFDEISKGISSIFHSNDFSSDHHLNFPSWKVWLLEELGF